MRSLALHLPRVAHRDVAAQVEYGTVPVEYVAVPVSQFTASRVETPGRIQCPQSRFVTVTDINLGQY